MFGILFDFDSLYWSKGRFPPPLAAGKRNG